jgi:hypothetical protein
LTTRITRCRVSVERGLMRTTIVVALVSSGVVASFLPITPPTQAAAPQSAISTAALKDRFVGTWRLVATERRDATGALVTPPTSGSQSRIGFIVYDPSGYMAVAIMQPGRPAYAGQQPLPEEARKALGGYTSYFGTYSVNEVEYSVTHHTQGALNIRMSGTDQKRVFEFSGDRLTLKPPVGANGIQARLTWERVPDLPDLTPMHRRFIGFWRLVSNERRNGKGELVSSNPGQTGFIVYTSTGHMMAHLMRADRKPYAAAQPTGEEAIAALRTYASYFGPYTIHEQDRYVVHHRIGIINPGQIGSDAKRHFEFSDGRLTLRPPPTTLDGQEVQGTITWERLTADGRPR